MITVSRLYKDHDTGARVVTELERSGIPRDEISIIASNESGWFDRDRAKTVDRDADGVDDRAEGAAKGAGIGGALAASRDSSPGLDCWPSLVSARLLLRGGWPLPRQWPRPAVLPAG